MKHIKKHRKVIIGAIAIVLFLFIARSVYVEEITAYDRFAHDLVMNTLRCEPLTFVMKAFTFLCSVGFLLFVCVFTFLLSDNKKETSLISINLIVVFLLNTLAKYIVQRPRPLITEFLIDETGFSFPSGHSMVSMAFYGYLVYLIYKNEKNNTKKYLECFGLLFVILMIGISRVYLGVHYASDVLAGFLLSIAYLMIFITFSPKLLAILNKRKKNNGKKEKN